jgi:hypothetical protein
VRAVWTTTCSSGRPSPRAGSGTGPLVLDDDARDEDGWRHRAGFDRDGRPVVFRHEPPSEGPAAGGWEEVVSYGPGRVEVDQGGAGRITTTFDASGRAERTVYVDEDGSQDVETYTYDDAGRLVGIVEATTLDTTCADLGRGDGWPTGGLVTVRHDERGMAEITAADGAAVWTRDDEPWPAVLERGLNEMRDEAVQTIADMITREDAAARTGPVLALGLCFTAGMGLGCFARLVIDAPDAVADHVGQVLVGTAFPALIVDDLIEPDLDDEARLIRQASAHQPADPVRFLLGALAQRLAAHDWSGLLSLAPEFAVFLGEHDAGTEPMWRSLTALNHPDRVALWTARWP